MRDKKQQIELASILLDWTVYPRLSVDDVHVRAMVDALAAGRILPPMILDANSKRPSDGFHRMHAYRRFYKDDHALIDVILRDYPDEAAFVEDAIRCNASHGRPFSPGDRARCSIIAEEVGLSLERVADALNMTRERYDTLVVRKVGNLINGRAIVIKETMSHLAGMPISAQQAEGIRKAGGMSPGYYVNQVINMLERDGVDWTNAKLVDRLRYLEQVLLATLAVNQPASKAGDGLFSRPATQLSGIPG